MLRSKATAAQATKRQATTHYQRAALETLIRAQHQHVHTRRKRFPHPSTTAFTLHCALRRTLRSTLTTDVSEGTGNAARQPDAAIA